MLEYIKGGDLVVFTDGSEAMIVRKVRHDDDSVTLFFNRRVVGRHGGRSESRWLFRNDGLWDRPDTDCNKCNDIIKVIPC